MTIYRNMRRRAALTFLAAAAALAVSSASALAQFRIGTYNVEADVNGNTGPNPGLTTVLQGIGNETVNGFSRPLDILALQETTSNVLTVDPIVNSLNSVYTPAQAVYARPSYQADQSGGTGTGNGPNAILYNTKSVQLIGALGVGTVSSSGPPRRIARYQFRPVGYGAESDFYVYVSHMKASNGADNEARRDNEAIQIRNNAATLPAGSRIMYMGDYNFVAKTAEPAWTTLTSAGTSPSTQGIDPAGGSFARQYWSEATTDLFARYDFQMVTPPVNDGQGFSLMSGSYHTFANNGTTPTGAAVTSASNTAAPTVPNRSAVLSAMTTAADHYPVIANYRLPAKIGVTNNLPTRVIQGASVSGSATVTNAAPVQIATGADVLNYSLTAGGSFSGSGNGANVAALSAGNAHALSFDTSTAGTKTGTLTVTTTSQDTAPAVNVPLSVDVLEHAHPVLSRQTINFDGVAMTNGGAPNVRTASLFLANTLGANITAGLDLDSINAAGATDVFSTNAGPFTNLPAGPGTSSNHPFNVSITSSHKGFFSATYTFNMSDENLPGAINLAPLTLTVTGRIAPAGDVDFSGDVTLGDFAVVDGNNGASFSARWGNGDFNGDGSVNFVDFAMMDEIYVLQTDGGGLSGTMARAIRYLDGSDRNVDVMSTRELQRVVQDFDRFGESYATHFLAAVPEPTALVSLLTLAVSLRRRTRHPAYRKIVGK